MTSRARVAVLRTQPDTLLEDYQRLFELADGAGALERDAIPVLKDNISRQFPMPSANTTACQLQGTVLAFHDYIHWPLKERHIHEDWRAHTPWGQLFQQSQQQGCLAGGCGAS